MAYTEGSKIQGSGQNLYTQKFSARTGSRSGAYTKSSKSPGPGRTCILKFSGPEQALGLERIQKARKVRAPGRNLYTQIFRARAGSWSGAYTESSKSQGPGQNLYTQKFRIQVRILVVGVYSILEFFGAGQTPDLGRIQKARKNWASGQICILKNSGPGQVPG